MPAHFIPPYGFVVTRYTAVPDHDPVLYPVPYGRCYWAIELTARQDY